MERVPAWNPDEHPIAVEVTETDERLMRAGRRDGVEASW